MNKLFTFGLMVTMCVVCPILGIPAMILFVLIELTWILLCKAQPKGSSNDIL